MLTARSLRRNAPCRTFGPARPSALSCAAASSSVFLSSMRRLRHPGGAARGATMDAALHASSATLRAYRTPAVLRCRQLPTTVPTPGTEKKMKDVASVYWSSPLPERLAAATVVRFMMEGFSHSADKEPKPTIGVVPLPAFSISDGPTLTAPDIADGQRRSDRTGSAIYAAMPMKLFIDRIPSAAGDAIFQSQQDAVSVVRNAWTNLLEVVAQHEDGRATVEQAGTQEAATAARKRRYGDVLHVRVKGGEETAARLLELLREDENSSKPAAASPTAGASPLSKPTTESQRATGMSLDAADASAESAPAEAGRITLAHIEAILSTLVGVLLKRESSAESQGSRYTVMDDAFMLFMREVGKHPEDATLEWLAHHLTREQFADVLLGLLPEDVSPATADAATTEATQSTDAAAVASVNALAKAKVEAALWVLQDRYVAVRKPEVDGDVRPVFTNPQPRVRHAGPENHYGGWGGADAVPTKEDVYEILKYVPVNWGNMGNLNIPPAIKRKHLRSGSPLQWFRRQPFYFEVRDMNGTTEIRRSCVLHPEAHGLTPEAAREQLELALASGEANDLTPLGPNGVPLATQMSAAEKAIHKFFLRVCPPYFAPLSLVMQRYTKKNLTEAMLLAVAEQRPGEFEVLRSRYVDTPLVRKRVGADSHRWRDAFMADLEKHPEDVRGIVMIMNRLCPSWDRPEYVYVRLTAEEQRAMGGFDAMMTILRRHPEIFRVGEHFVCRVDSSDPFSSEEAEPSAHDLTSRTYLREENPYLSPIDLALVFHYAAPAEEPCTAAFLVDCASPAMRVALPPRVVTIVQQFPRLFACKETAPGVFSIRKMGTASTTATAAPRSPAAGSPNPSGQPAPDGTPASLQSRSASATDTPAEDGIHDGDAEDNSWMELEAEIAEEEHLTKPQLLAAVVELIPQNGVEASQLLLWASLSVQRAASHYYGGLLKMVDSEKTHFDVVEQQESKMVYRRKPSHDTAPH